MTTEEKKAVLRGSVERLSSSGAETSTADRDGIIETLQHALEALTWHNALDFERDDYKIGERIKATLANLGHQ